jgi:protein O-GlcNAc transferase
LFGNPEEYLVEAGRLVDAGALREAVALLERVTALEQDNVPLLTLLAECYCDQEQYAAATETFESIIAFEPNYASARSRYSNALFDLGKIDEAIEQMQIAVNIEPTAARYSLLGVYFEETGRAEDAETCYRQAITLAPAFTEALLNWARLIRRRDPGEARRLMREAIRIEPDYAEAHRELGWELIELNRLEDAERSLRLSLELKPQQAWARIYLGHLMRRRKDLDSAEQEYMRAAIDAPLWSLPLRQLGLLYSNLNRVKDAERCLTNAYTHEPTDEGNAFQLARFYLKTGNIDDAQTWISRAIAIAPDDQEFLEFRTLLQLSGEKRSPED